MASNASLAEQPLPQGAAPLSAEQLDAVSGGNAYYSVFFWIGEQFGAIGRMQARYTQYDEGVNYVY